MYTMYINGADKRIKTITSSSPHAAVDDMHYQTCISGMSDVMK